MVAARISGTSLLPDGVVLSGSPDRSPVAGARCFREADHVEQIDAFTGICDEKHIQPMLETFAALAEPNRLRIVELLRDGPRLVGAIGAALRLNQPQVSKHLRC
jgi:hypothetical protein